MFDGSHYPIEENVEKTKELIRICRVKRACPWRLRSAPSAVRKTV